MKKPASEPPARIATEISLNAIKRVSSLNSRTSADAADTSQLAASILASGQLQPLLVSIEEDGYAILDGQLRWRAMLSLAADSHWPPDHPVYVEIVGREEPELREIALAVNTLRRDLHPVEEYRAFESLRLSGFDEQRIAKDFGFSLRHMRQRLALGALAPRILDAWLEGKIGADSAQAFTAAENHAAQEAAFEQLIANGHGGSYSVRKLLLSGSRPSDCKEALYVGVDAYTAAGGRIKDDLFSDESVFLDGALVEKLAGEKLKAAASVAAETEGWGFFETAGREADYKTEDPRPDFLDEEAARLAEIDALRELTIELEDERDAIATLGFLRAIPRARRAGLGLFAHLDFRGRPVFTRGLLHQLPKDSPASAPVASRRAKNGAAAVSSAAAAPAGKKLSKTVRAILDAAVKEAFQRSIAGRPDIAMMLAMASLGCIAPSYSDGPLSSLGPPFDRRPAYNSCLLQKIRNLDFDAAIGLCEISGGDGITAAFAELIAASISPKGKSLSVFGPLARAINAHGAALGGHLVEAFDYEAYFAAATMKARADIAGELELVKANKKSLSAETLSLAARDKRWLPEPLKSWAAVAPGEARSFDPPASSGEASHDPEDEAAEYDAAPPV